MENMFTVPHLFVTKLHFLRIFLNQEPRNITVVRFDTKEFICLKSFEASQHSLSELESLLKLYPLLKDNPSQDQLIKSMLNLLDWIQIII